MVPAPRVSLLRAFVPSSAGCKILPHSLPASSACARFCLGHVWMNGVERRHFMRRRAFTLVELLVVIGIIAVLIAILLPTLQKAKESANRVKCCSNIRQITMAMLMYSTDDKKHVYLYSNGPNGNDSLYLLHPWPAPSTPPDPYGGPYGGPIYLSDFKAAICPSTNHRVTSPAMLRENAGQLQQKRISEYDRPRRDRSSKPEQQLAHRIDQPWRAGDVHGVPRWPCGFRANRKAPGRGIHGWTLPSGHHQWD